MSSSLVVVSAILLALLIVWICAHSRRRRPGEPPLVSGWVPLLGVTLEYGRNPLLFLREAQRTHGDVFTCSIAGKYFTFVTDPFSFPAVVRQSRHLDFNKFALGFSRRVFGHANFNDPQFRESYKEVHGLFRQTLQGLALQELGESMMLNLQTVLGRENKSMLCNPHAVLDRENESMMCNPQKVLDRENESMMCNPQKVLDRENESMMCNPQTVLDRENESMMCNPQKVLDRENESMMCNPQKVLDREIESMMCNPQKVLDRENESMMCNPQKVLDRENESMMCNPQKVLDRENESMMCNPQKVLDRENESMMCNPQTVLDRENESMMCNPQKVLDRENESMMCNPQKVLDRENESMMCNPQKVLDRENESMMCNPQKVLDRENESMMCNPQKVLDRENESMMCNPQTVLDRENESMMCNPQTVLDQENESMCDPQKVLDQENESMCDPQKVLDREIESMMCNPQKVLDREIESMMCNPEKVLDQENESMMCNPQAVLDRENESTLCDPQAVLDRENESILCDPQAVLDRENESTLCDPQAVLDRENESTLCDPQAVLDRENGYGSEPQWLEEGLQSFTNRIMFEAGFLTLFGRDPGFLQASRTHMREFLAFDHAFPFLAAGVPIGLIPGVWRAREALAKELTHEELHQRKCVSDLIHRRMEAFDRMHLDETGKARTHVCMLWASQANTLPAAFWSLYYTLRSADALTAARTEINSVLSGQILNSQDQRLELSLEQLNSMTVLESIIKEALRLSSASMMIRVANEDFTLRLDSGQTADIRRGDHVALYPQLIHLDPEIYPDPSEFRFDRFLDENGERKTHFFRNGRRLNHFLMPFGSGASECPGRFFALHEIKQFLAVTLWRYDLHLCDAGAPLETDARRVGLGVLPPSRDVPLRYRRRTHTRHEENTHHEERK